MCASVFSDHRYGFSVFGLAFPDSADYLAGLLGIPLVENVDERHQLHSDFGRGVHAFLNEDKCHAQRRVHDLQQTPHFDLLTTKAAEIFYDNRTNQPVLHHFLHLLEAVTMKGGAGSTVIYEELRVFVTVPPGIVRKNLLLRRDLSRVISAKEFYSQKSKNGS